MCGEFTGEKDEYDIYLEALKGGIEGVTNLLCRNEEEIILNSCGSKGKRDELWRDWSTNGFRHAGRYVQ